MMALYGTYCDVRCCKFTVGFRIFPVRVLSTYSSEHLSEEFFGNKGAKCTPWTQEPRLTIFEVAVIEDLAVRSKSENGKRSKYLSVSF